MSAKFFTATLTAAGTPQKLISSITPSLPTITGLLGGSPTERAYHLKLQAWPSNTGTNIYIGGPTLNKTGPVACGAVLTKTGNPTDFGQVDSNFALDDIWFDGDTTSDKLLITIIG